MVRRILRFLLKKSFSTSTFHLPTEEKYKRIFETINEGYFEVDLEGNIIFFNDAFCSMIGRTRYETEGLNLKLCLSDEMAKHVFTTFDNILKTGETIKLIEWDIQKKDGTIRNIEASVYPTHDSKEEINGFRIMARDITEKKEAERNLRETQEKLNLIINNVSDGIFICDVKGRFKFMNRAGLAHLGVSAEEIVNKNYLHYIVPEQRERELNLYIKQVMENIEETYHEYQVKNERNEILWVGQTVRMMKDREGNLEFYGIVRNITEQKRIEQTLRDLDRQKSDFFANISHEIRTPLTLILSPIESAIQGEYGEYIDIRFLENIHKNAIKLLKLINNILDFSRIEAGRMTMKVKEADIVEFARRYVDTVHSAARSKNISLMLNAPYEKINLFIDLEKMDKIFMNLLSNALKFTERGGTISININADDTNCFVEFKDSGVGIPADKINIIFDRFAQADTSSTRRYEGTGIGLALAKEFVEMHCGTIKVESKHIDDFPTEHGTTFILTLPRGKKHFQGRLDVDFVSDSDIDEAIINRRFTGMREMYDLKETIFSEKKSEATFDKTILVVDDNADMRNFLISLLKKHYNVHYAINGEDGLQKTETLKPDLIITDVMMPIMDGHEMTKRIKENEKLKYTPVIMLTARADISHKIEGLEFGADDYLTKPFNSKELLTRVANLIKMKSQEKELHDAYEKLNRAYQDMKNDLYHAKKIQNSILPQNIQSLDGLQFHIKYLPLIEVGGDIYDIHKLENKIRIFLADTTGHGVMAALTTMLIKGEYDLFKEKFADPVELFATLNKIMFNTYQTLSIFFTGIIIDIDLTNGIMEYASAGHPVQFLLQNYNIIELPKTGRAVGLWEKCNVKKVRLSFTKGERLILFTDGIFEEFNTDQEQYGEERLKALIRKNALTPMNVLINNILDDVYTFTNHNILNDDITIIGIE